MTAAVAPLFPAGTIGRVAAALASEGNAARYEFMVGPIAMRATTIREVLLLTLVDDPRFAYGVTATDGEYDKAWAVVTPDLETVGGLVTVTSVAGHESAIGLAITLLMAQALVEA